MNLKMKFATSVLTIFQTINVSAQELSKSELETAMAPGNLAINKDPAKRIKAILGAECAGTALMLRAAPDKGKTTEAIIEDVYKRASQQTYKYFDNDDEGTERIRNFASGTALLVLFKRTNQNLYDARINMYSDTVLDCNRKLER